MGVEIPDVGFEVGELEIDVSDKSELKLIVEGLNIETEEEDVVIFGHCCIDGPGRLAIFGIDLFEHHVNFGFRF
jgi:hypothetical protein